MDYLIIFLLIVNITLAVMGLKRLKQAVSNNISPADKPKKKELTVEEKAKKDRREKQMQNFLSYTGDKQ